MQTPEFLLWALEYRCTVRGEQDGRDPERTERQLRSARAYAEALREGRTFEGLAIEPPDGFRVADALALYGGESAVVRACRGCPANSSPTDEPAGCFGFVALAPEAAAWHAAIEQAVDRLDIRTQIKGLFAATQPSWYGLWLTSPLSAEQLALIEQLAAAAGMEELFRGCRSARVAGLHMHVRLYPPGRIQGGWWRHEPHCSRCKAMWPGVGSRTCEVCGYAGHPAPDTKRRPRGRRPYVPLDHVIGAGQASGLLARYLDFQMRRQSRDPLQSPLLQEPPDNLPVD